jgi:hypothetical protein
MPHAIQKPMTVTASTAGGIMRMISVVWAMRPRPGKRMRASAKAAMPAVSSVMAVEPRPITAELIR